MKRLSYFGLLYICIYSVLILFAASLAVGQVSSPVLLTQGKALGIQLASSQSESQVLHFPKLGLSAKWSWSQQPSVRPPIEGRLEILLNQISSGSPFDIERPSDLKVILWMEMPGGHSHGSAPTQIQRLMKNDQVVPGGYVIRNMHFYMEGLWEVRISLNFRGLTESVGLPLSL